MIRTDQSKLYDKYQRQRIIFLRLKILLNTSLVEKWEIVSDESKVATSFSNFFENVDVHLVSKQNDIFKRDIFQKLQLKFFLRSSVRSA